jgi:hypothetical protein
MVIDIRFRNLQSSSALRAYAARRIRSHFGPFGEAVHGVVVRFGDVNGPRGGVDKRCGLSVYGPRLDANVDELSHCLYAGIDAAVKRAARAVERRVERGRRWR